MKRQNENFFDMQTMGAIVLVAVTFFGWQFYMQKKYPDAYKKKPPVAEVNQQAPETSQEKSTVQQSKSQQVTQSDKAKELSTSVIPSEEKLIHFDSENLAFDLSSNGMGIKNLVIKKYTDRNHKVVELGLSSEGKSSLQTSLRGASNPLQFEIQSSGPNAFVGRAKFGSMEIVKTMEIRPEKYLIVNKVASVGSDDRFLGIRTQLTEPIHEVKKTGFFAPNNSYQEFFLETADNSERHRFDKDNFSKDWSKVQVASIGSAYFTQAVVDLSNIMPHAEASIDHPTEQASLTLDYEVLSQQGLQLEYWAYVGPKSLEILESVNGKLSNVVDFGYFNWIGRKILILLKWFHGWSGNWGFAIILLTLLVRLMVLPFNLYSFRSMKAMQLIQPQMQAIREKYKEDQQTQQQQIMKLMRDNKVNPLGGCLPMLVQFPIFIALYQVLGHSIELYQAPFILWIHDLSFKDPYYILPVLMGVTMFIQQKITPNTMDPAQARIMLFMPLIFIIFMIEIASGLSLYMWVGAIFGVLQQTYFMRRSPVVALEK